MATFSPFATAAPPVADDLVDDLAGGRRVGASAFGGGAEVVDDDLRPLGGEQPGVAAADPSSRSRDDGDLAVQQSPFPCHATSRTPAGVYGLGSEIDLARIDEARVARAQRRAVGRDDAQPVRRELAVVGDASVTSRELRARDRPEIVAGDDAVPTRMRRLDRRSTRRFDVRRRRARSIAGRGTGRAGGVVVGRVGAGAGPRDRRPSGPRCNVTGGAVVGATASVPASVARSTRRTTGGAHAPTTRTAAPPCPAATIDDAIATTVSQAAYAASNAQHATRATSSDGPRGRRTGGARAEHAQGEHRGCPGGDQHDDRPADSRLHGPGAISARQRCVKQYDIAARPSLTPPAEFGTFRTAVRRTLELSMEIFTRAGLWGAFRMAHVIVAIMWMGLLWFFNFVQMPSYAEMEAAARNNALDKLTWRAMWWFRWSAMATIVFGLLIIAVEGGSNYVYNGDFWRSTSGVTLLIGILFGFIMLYNVWMVIWPAQQIVIGNARNVQAGGEADPNAAAAGRAAGMASRQNTIFSLPLLVFMVGASHFYSYAHVHFSRQALDRPVAHLPPDRHRGGDHPRGERAREGERPGQQRPQRDLRDAQERDVHRLRADPRVLPARGDHAPQLAPLSGVEQIFGDARPVPGAAAEHRLARLDALHEELHVVLPRVADAAEDLDAFLGEQALAVARRGLRHRRRVRASRVVLGDRERGEVAE